MADRGLETRERILAAAEPLVLRQGYAGTSLDDILEETKLTKGAFFHHFKDKAEFARALVERYAARDQLLFEGFAAKAEAESAEPIEQTVIFLKAAEDFIAGAAEPIDGCLFASYSYEMMQFDRSIHAFVAQGFHRWAAIYERKFASVLAAYEPAAPVTARELSEAVMAALQGGFVLARSLNDPMIVVRALQRFRDYFEQLFAARKKRG